MVRYRQNFVAGGTFFFTVTLFDRTSNVLVAHVDGLRAAVRVTRGEHPFAIDAIVVMPDHLHMVVTLSEADANFSGRLSLIKRKFTAALHPLQSGEASSGHTRERLALLVVSSLCSTRRVAV